MPSVFLECFERVVRDRPDDVLVWAPHENLILHASNLRDEAGLMSRALTRAGLTRGDVVMSLVGNQSSFIALTLACLAGGWPLMPADRGTPIAEAFALAERWGAAALVVAERPEEPAVAASVEPLPGGLWAIVPSARPDAGRYGDAAVLKLTSGSTGVPKLTLTEERHLLADVTQVAAAMDIGPRTRQLGVIPLSHSYGFSNLVLPLLWQGSPLLLRPGFVPTQVADDATSFGTETWAGVPFMFEHVARHVRAPFPPTIRTLISAGAPLAFEVVAAFQQQTGRKVHSFYGSSETGGICYDASDAVDPDVPVGRPLGDTVVSLREDPDAPAGSGRIVVHGPAVVSGYAGGDDPEAFVEGAFVTGDFGRRRADGALVLTGRAAAAVNVAGRKVLPSEVEAAIRAVPGIRDVVVVGVTDARRGQTVGACFVADRRIAPVALRAALTSQLAAYKLPRVIVQMDALPMTARGKHDRQAIGDALERAGRQSG